MKRNRSVEDNKAYEKKEKKIIINIMSMILGKRCIIA